MSTEPIRVIRLREWDFCCTGRAILVFGDNQSVCISAGDLVYIPPAIPYTSYWNPEDNAERKLEFYVIEFDLERRNPQICTFEKFENKFTRTIFDEIYSLAKRSRKKVCHNRSVFSNSSKTYGISYSDTKREFL